MRRPRTPPTDPRPDEPRASVAWAVDWLADRLGPTERDALLAEDSARRLGGRRRLVFGMLVARDRECLWRSELYLDVSVLLRDGPSDPGRYVVRLARGRATGPDELLGSAMLARDDANVLADTARGLGVTVRRATRLAQEEGGPR